MGLTFAITGFGAMVWSILTFSLRARDLFLSISCCTAKVFLKLFQNDTIRTQDLSTLLILLAGKQALSASTRLHWHCLSKDVLSNVYPLQLAWLA